MLICRCEYVVDICKLSDTIFNALLAIPTITETYPE